MAPGMCRARCVRAQVQPPLAPKGNPRARSAYALSACPAEKPVAAGAVIANVHSDGGDVATPRSVEDNTRTMLCILLVEDHPHLAEELRTTLEELVDAHIVATAAAEADACAWMDGGPTAATWPSSISFCAKAVDLGYSSTWPGTSDLRNGWS